MQRTSEDAAREATIYLRANSVVKGDSPAVIVWQRPRFEATNQPPLLLSDYPNYGPRYESDLSAIFASTGPYLTAVMTVAHNSDLTTAEAAKRHGLDLEWLQRWQDVSSIVPIARGEPRTVVGRTVPPLKLTLLDEKTPANAEHTTVSGWRPKGAELPVVVGNSSDETRQIPGRIGAHRVAVHPMPAEFVAVAWRSPIEGRIRVQAKIAHAHSACGNGVAWRIESQTPGRSAVLSAGVLELGRQGESPSQDISVSKNDEIILAVDARDSNHVCDLTEISLTLTELTGDKRVWDLAADAADRLGESNPLSDKFGNSEVWRFARGPSSDRPVGEAAHAAASSLFARWRDAAADSARKDEAIELVDQIQAVLTGPRPAEKDPNRGMYDEFVAVDGPLLRNLDLTKLTKSPIQKAKLGLDAAKFGKSPNDEPIDSASLSTHADETLTIRVPAELLRGRTFVVEGRLSGRSDDCVVQLRVGFSDDAKIDFGAPLLALEKSGACARLQSSLQEFRRVFPPFICYPYVLPIDEVVCLKTFHREDEPLIRLFLDEEQTRRIDHLWAQHRFISRFPVVENDYLPLFIGFVTQDQPKE
ncbi:MAG TPA: hypothetical protein VGE52_02770, partial [Pirellulales bacterium]